MQMDVRSVCRGFILLGIIILGDSITKTQIRDIISTDKMIPAAVIREEVATLRLLELINIAILIE
jgi:hypothetical protein